MVRCRYCRNKARLLPTDEKNPHLYD
jgi:hypothetical protein